MLGKSAVAVALLATVVSANSTSQWSTTDQVFTDSGVFYTTAKGANKTSTLTPKNVPTSDSVITTSAPFTTARRTSTDDSNGTERTSSTGTGTLLQALTSSSSSGSPSSSGASNLPNSSAVALPQALTAIAFSIILSIGAGLLLRY